MERFATQDAASGDGGDIQPQTTPAHSKPAASAPDDSPEHATATTGSSSGNNSEDQVDYALQVYKTTCFINPNHF